MNIVLGISSRWWNNGGAKDDFALGIYGCRDFDLGRGWYALERWKKKVFFFNWLGRWVFWSFTFVSLKQYTYASHMHIANCAYE